MMRIKTLVSILFLYILALGVFVFYIADARAEKATETYAACSVIQKYAIIAAKARSDGMLAGDLQAQFGQFAKNHEIDRDIYLFLSVLMHLVYEGGQSPDAAALSVYTVCLDSYKALAEPRESL